MRIFFVHSGNESFVRLDRDLLSEAFDVHDFHAIHKFPRGFLRYLRGLRESDVLFCWFASWNCFWALLLARLFQKPSILIIGGYDLANLPEANYGHQRGGPGKWVSRAAMQLAKVLVTNSVYSQQEAETNAGIPAHEIRVIYHGVSDQFGEIPAVPREQMALTVGNVEWPNLKRKGLETFVRAAASLPDVQFVLAGAWKDDSIDHLRSMATTNVSFTGYLSETDLIDLYKRASIYVQASLHEGFGMSLAEAMLAGCIPVVTQAGALPEVVGEYGFICETGYLDAIEKSIRCALDAPAENRIQVRDHILTSFPLAKRKQALTCLLQSLE
jgi:glycosyltransferase involved in cell wall biosynthesis